MSRSRISERRRAIAIYGRNCESALREADLARRAGRLRDRAFWRRQARWFSAKAFREATA